MPQEAGRIVQKHDVESVARHDTSQPVKEERQRRSNIEGGRGDDLDCQVDVALPPLSALGVRAEKVRELDLGERVQNGGQPCGQIGV